MTTESVDIQVQGTVKPKIETDLRGIAAAATEGYSALERLQKMLNQLNTGGVSGIQNAMKGATSEIEKQTRALNDAAASSRMQAANLRVLQQQAQQTASAQQKVAETAKTSSDRMLEMARNAVKAAQAERDKSAAFFEASRAVNSESVATQRNVQFTQEQIRAAQEATRAARDKIAATNAQAAAEEQLQSTQQRSTLGWRDYNSGLQKTGQNAQIARHHLLNLGFQLQDIGVSLASGQNPLTVAVQQGAQIQGIASQASVSMGRLAAAAAAMIAPFLPLAAAVGALAAGLKIMSLELSKNSGLEKFSKDLGLTNKEIKSMHGDVVTMTDVFKAFFTTVSEVSGLDKTTKGFFDKLKAQYKDFVNTTVQEFNMIGAVSDGVANAFLTAWRKLPADFRNIFVVLYNNGAKIIEALVNVTIAGVNQITSALNKVTKLQIPEIAAVPFARMEASKPAEEGKSIAEAYAEGYENSMKIRTKQFDNFYKKWQENSVKGAQERIKKEFEDGGGAKDAAESRAAALAKINAQLDNQLDRMRMLKPVREEQQQFDQIEEQLLGKKIMLNAAEAASIRDKISAISAQKQATQEMDKVYEEIQGPTDEYIAKLSAIDNLLATGFLTQNQYQAKLDSAVEAYNQSIDPLRKYRQEIEFATVSMGLNNQQLEIAQQRRQIEQEALRNGIELRKSDVDALMQQAEAAQYAQGVQQEYAQIYAENGGQLEQLRQRQDALNLAQQNGVVSAAAYQNQMVQLGLQAAQLRLAMDQAVPGDTLTASFAQLLDGYQNLMTGVANSLGTMFNSVADGFANALAGALIGTENLGEAIKNVARGAIQQLIAGLIKLGIQYVINAALAATLGAAATATSVGEAAITATAWAPAAALASLATLGANSGPAVAGMGATIVAAKSFAALSGVGFQDGGYTGSGPVDKVAGIVHAGEYVMRADTVSKLGVGTMDAIQNGKPLTNTSLATASSREVVTSSNANKNSKPGNTYVNFIEDASKAGTVEQRTDENGDTQIKGFVANIREQGEAATALERAYGLKRVGA